MTSFLPAGCPECGLVAGMFTLLYQRAWKPSCETALCFLLWFRDSSIL